MPNRAEYNNQIVSGLPWLQDTVADDTWTKWGVTYRDVRILNSRNELVGVFNLTQHDLANEAKRISLKQLLQGQATAVDSDSDRLADQWEVANFGNLGMTAAQDSDQDGLSNGAEYAFGTDPKQAAQMPALSFEVTQNLPPKKFVLKFKRRLGTQLEYFIEGSNDLKVWSNLLSGPAPQGRNLFDGSGLGEVSWPITASADQAYRFFRVRVP